jgi:hypothetical protein
MAVMHLWCVSEAERVMQWINRQEGWDGMGGEEGEYDAMRSHGI